MVSARECPFGDNCDLMVAYLAGYEKARADLVPGWSSDMDAAPKDGTRILTFHPANPGAIIERARQDNYVINAMKAGQWWYSLPEQPPVAWMPLPAPPKGETCPTFPAPLSCDMRG